MPVRSWRVRGPVRQGRWRRSHRYASKLRGTGQGLPTVPASAAWRTSVTPSALYNRGIGPDSVVKVIEALVQQGRDGAVEFNQLQPCSMPAAAPSVASDGRRHPGPDRGWPVAWSPGRSARSPPRSPPTRWNGSARPVRQADVIQQLTGGTLTRVHAMGPMATKKMVNGRMVETEVGGSTRDQYAGGVEVGTDANRAQLRDINTPYPTSSRRGQVGNAGKLFWMCRWHPPATPRPSLARSCRRLPAASSRTARPVRAGQGRREGRDDRTQGAVEALLKQFQAADVAPGTSQKTFDERMDTGKDQTQQSHDPGSERLGDALAPTPPDHQNPGTAMAAILGSSTALGEQRPRWQDGRRAYW